MVVFLVLVLPPLIHSMPLEGQALPAARELPFSLSAPSTDCQQRTAEDFVPMTRSERVAYAVNRAVGPSALINSAIRASLNEGLNRPKEWGQGIDGFGKRVGSTYAQHFIGTALENGAAYALHEDNRYFASGMQSKWGRLLYAGESTVLARHDDGTRSLSVSAIGGAAGAAFLSRTWQPPSSRSVDDAMISFGLSLAMRAAFNVAREFSPPLLRRLVP